jgi:hypothetical protein
LPRAGGRRWGGDRASDLFIGRPLAIARHQLLWDALLHAGDPLREKWLALARQWLFAAAQRIEISDRVLKLVEDIAAAFASGKRQGGS